MKKYLVWMENVRGDAKLEDIRENTVFEYYLGEVITVNNTNKYKCIRKEVINGNLYHYFKKGQVSYSFD